MKRLVLLGGGPAHLHTLQALACERLAGAEVLMVAPQPRHFHAPLLAGCVGGRLRAVDCSIALPPLAAAAGVRWVEGAAQVIDAEQRQVILADGRVAEYDVLSLDTEPAIDRDRIPGAREHGLFVRPIEHFARLSGALVDLASQRVLDVVVVGAGDTGFQLALALQHRLAAHEERARIALVTGGPLPLARHAPAVVARGLRRLAAQRITVLREVCTAIDARAVHLANGARLACDAAVIATGAEAPPLLAASGLALDESGFVAVGPTLQSRSHPMVFAAAAGAAPQAHAVLALNLRRFVGGGDLRPAPVPGRRLEWLSCGDRRAIAAWGGWSAEGRWLAWWKDRVDRGFVRRHLTPSGATPG
jgi:NADH dehydrogenase FAD-containing subunit